MLGKVQVVLTVPPIVTNKFVRAFLSSGAIALLVSGCASMAPDSSAPEIAAGVPQQYDKVDVDGAYEPAQWWASFQDPVLNELLDEALAKNLDLAEASARLRAAEAQARVSKSGLFPQVSGSLGSSYSDSPTDGTGFSFGGGSQRLQTETYTSDLAFSYEVDLWGKLRDDARAGRADAIAAAADLQAARLAVMAETITSYFDIVDARDQIVITTKIIDVLGDRVEQSEDRYRRGLTTSFELYQVLQDFRNIQAGLPQRESQLTATEGQLAVLIGRYSDNMDSFLGQKLAPKLIFTPIPSGLPIDLLAQRPDIYAEGQRLESTRFNLGARKAERFPAISLSTGTGTQAGEAAGLFDIFDNWVFSLGASLTAPLFDGGRIRANIEIADAQYAQQAAVYARTVLTAYQEVGSAIEGYEEERQRYRFLFSQLDEATAAAQLQSRRFATGVGSYVDYLDALRAQYQVQSALSSAARDVALARLAVHRALGGSWDKPVTITADEDDDLKAVESEIRREE